MTPLPRGAGMASGDPAEAVARVALARRDLLLRAHRHRLRPEDLEDCYSQATLELMQRARSGVPFANAGHIANAIEQRLLSRVHDRRRALGGRSPIEAALGQAVAIDAPDASAGQLVDPGPGVDEQVAMRTDIAVLHEIARDLTPDMRLVLWHQALGTECQEFCRRFNWSAEKFRKVAQRARRRLLALSEEYVAGERCRRLESDLLACVSRVADEAQRARVAAHLDNCTACRRRARDLRVAERGVLGLLPGGLGAGSAGLSGAAGGGAGAVAAAGGGVAAWGGPGLLGVKLGVAAVCLASLAGGGMALCHAGPLAPLLGVPHAAHRRVVTHASPARAPARPRSVVAVAASGPGPSREVVSGSPGRWAVTAPVPASVPSPAPSPAAAADREFGFSGLTGTAAPSVPYGDSGAARVAKPASGSPRSHRRRRGRRWRAGATAAMVPSGTARTPTAASASAQSPTTPVPPGTGPAARAPAPRAASSPSPPSAGEFGFERG